MVSIIVPVCNSIFSLKKCIKSVLSQTFRQFELILVDDGSNDGSEKICDFYANKYKNVLVIHQSNKGPAAAREKGIMSSSGEFVMFLDADDWVDEKILEILLNHQRESNVEMVCCNFMNIYKSGKRKIPHVINEKIIDCRNPFDCIYQIHVTRNLITGPVMKLIRKTLFDGIDFNKHVTIGEDYAMILQLVERAKGVRIINLVLYYRYIGFNNISRSGYTDRHKKALENYMQIRKRLISKYCRLSKYIIGYHLEFEMAVLTAMCRNDYYDKRIIIMLRNDLQKNLKIILMDKNVGFYLKVSAFIIAYYTKLFIFIFCIIHKMIGR